MLPSATQTAPPPPAAWQCLQRVLDGTDDVSWQMFNEGMHLLLRWIVDSIGGMFALLRHPLVLLQWVAFIGGTFGLGCALLVVGFEFVDGDLVLFPVMLGVCSYHAAHPVRLLDRGHR